MSGDDPRDECECGDFREDHKDGGGPCRYNSNEFDLSHGGGNCMEFRLFGRAGWRDATHD